MSFASGPRIASSSASSFRRAAAYIAAAASTGFANDFPFGCSAGEASLSVIGRCALTGRHAKAMEITAHPAVHISFRFIIFLCSALRVRLAPFRLLGHVVRLKLDYRKAHYRRPPPRKPPPPNPPPRNPPKLLCPRAENPLDTPPWSKPLNAPDRIPDPPRGASYPR